jgi:hypothetical protein
LGVVATGRTGRLRGSGDLVSLVISGCAMPLTLITADASCHEDAEALSVPYAVAGLFHASGVLADATLGNQTPSGIRRVFAPKVDALRRLKPRLGLQPGFCNVLFSSVASLLGSPGQANYSAANSWLDSAAEGLETEVRLCHLCLVLLVGRFQKSSGQRADSLQCAAGVNLLKSAMGSLGW